MGNELILLRGLFRGQYHWGVFLEYLQKKYPNKIISCLDIPGNGDLFNEKSPNTIIEMVESVRAQRNGNASAKVDIIAISMGGMIGLKWAELYPNEIDTLICINTTAKPFSPFYKRLLPKNYFKILRALFSNAYKRERMIYEMVSNKKVDVEIVKKWASYSLSLPMIKMNFFHQLRAAMTFKPRRPECRLFFISSLKDNLVSNKATRAIAEKWSVPLIINEFDGHDIPLDNPKWLCETLSRLL